MTNKPTAWERLGYEARRAAGAIRAFRAAWAGREWALDQSVRQEESER